MWISDISFSLITRKKAREEIRFFVFLFFRPKNEHKTNNQRKGQRGFLGPFPYFPDLSLFLSLFQIIMDNVYALNERAVRALEDNGITAKTMIRFARLGLYAQIVLALWGSLSFTYGIIHASALAVSLYGVVALELKTPRLLKIYAAVLLALTITDLLVVELYRFYLGWTNGREGSVLRHVVVRELELDDALPGVSRVFGSGRERVFVGNAMDERSVE